MFLLRPVFAGILSLGAQIVHGPRAQPCLNPVLGKDTLRTFIRCPLKVVIRVLLWAPSISSVRTWTRISHQQRRRSEYRKESLVVDMGWDFPSVFSLWSYSGFWIDFRQNGRRRGSAYESLPQRCPRIHCEFRPKTSIFISLFWLFEISLGISSGTGAEVLGLLVLCFKLFNVGLSCFSEALLIYCVTKFGKQLIKQLALGFLLFLTALFTPPPIWGVVLRHTPFGMELRFNLKP